MKSEETKSNVAPDTVKKQQNIVRLKKNKRLTATDIVKNSKLSLDDDKNGPIAADYFDERTSQNKQMDSLEPKKM